MARLLTAIALLLTATPAAALSVSATGPPVDVWGAVDTLHKCGFIDVPDIPARAWEDGSGVTHMVRAAPGWHSLISRSAAHAAFG